jgi:hypothetical protein
LEALRDYLPSSVRRTLRELPESLDETYERILKEITKPNRDLARRVLQCLVVATWPLRVAEVLAVDFDDVEGIPRLNSDWRWEDQEQALLIACSSLIAIVEAGDVKASDSDSDAEANDSAREVETGDRTTMSKLAIATWRPKRTMASRIPKVVIATRRSTLVIATWMSKLAIVTRRPKVTMATRVSKLVIRGSCNSRIFPSMNLTSSRLTTASGEVSNYHIDLEPAHTILAQACLGVLLQIQDDVEGCAPEDHLLARYAAEHWTTHAQFREVSSHLHKGMQYLFDANKPHFKVWLTLCDIDTNSDATFYLFTPPDNSPAAPLYYAALCGFHDLVEHLITKNSQDANDDGGCYVRPLVAALAGEHFQTADLLRHNGADLEVSRWSGY